MGKVAGLTAMSPDTICLSIFMAGTLGFISSVLLYFTLRSWLDFKRGHVGREAPLYFHNLWECLPLYFKSPAGYAFTAVSFTASIIGVIGFWAFPESSSTTYQLVTMGMWLGGLCLPIFAWIFRMIVNDILVQGRWLARALRDIPSNKRYFSTIRGREHWIRWRYTISEWKKFLHLLKENQFPFPSKIEWGLVVYAGFHLIALALQIYVAFRIGLPMPALWVTLISAGILVFILWHLYDGRFPRGLFARFARREVFIGPLGIWIPGVTYIFFHRPGDPVRPDELAGSETFMRIRLNRTQDFFEQAEIQQADRCSYYMIRFTRPDYMMAGYPFNLSRMKPKETIVLERSSYGIGRGGSLFFRAESLPVLIPQAELNKAQELLETMKSVYQVEGKVKTVKT